jgi:hypothetical protein
MGVILVAVVAAAAVAVAITQHFHTSRHNNISITCVVLLHLLSFSCTLYSVSKLYVIELFLSLCLGPTPIIATYIRSTAVWGITYCILLLTSLLEELITPAFRVEYMKMEAPGPFK